MRKTTIIFDMDGLMLDSERVTHEGYTKYVNALGYALDMSFYKTLFGLPMAGIAKRFREQYGADFPFEETAKKVHAYIAENFDREGVPLKKGLIELLDYLRANDFTCVVATSSDRVRVNKILAQAALAPYFHFYICGDEVSKGKPHPEVFLKCCQKVGCKPEQAIVLEDSEMGALAAHRAGIDCIIVPDMKQPDEQYRDLAYATVDSLLDVLSIIQAMEQKEL